MKKANSIFILCLSLVLLWTGTACRHEDNSGEQIDKNRTQLYVGNYYGGLGDEWFSDVIARFEADNPDIQVWIDNETDAYTDKNLITRLGSSRQDIYFTNGITYSQYVASGKLADLTKLMTTPMNELYEKDVTDGEGNVTGKAPVFSETYTIEDSMNDTLAEYYKTADNKYYAIPFYEAIFGLVYDIDLFDKKNLYFRDGKEDGTPGEGQFISDPRQTKSAGPDGAKGTYDDGLPATYTQFKTLMSVMKTRGVTPFIWNKIPSYRQRFLMSVWADYDGKENYDLNNSFDGTYTFDGDSVPTAITEYNADKLMYQGGHEYALQFARDIISDSENYYAQSFGPSNTHTAAQDAFLDSSRKGKPIGMMLEASWWENEARGTFADMADTYGESYAKGARKFGFMPIPKADGGKSAAGATLLGVSGQSVVCIDDKSPRKDLAIKFLAYCQTQQSLSDFTEKTGVIRAYDYGMTEEQLGKMTQYSRTMWNTYRAKDAKICYNTIFTSGLKLSSPSTYTTWGWSSIIDGAQYDEPFDAFYANSEFTVKQYLDGTAEWAKGFVKKQ